MGCSLQLAPRPANKKFYYGNVSRPFMLMATYFELLGIFTRNIKRSNTRISPNYLDLNHIYCHIPMKNHRSHQTTLKKAIKKIATEKSSSFSDGAMSHGWYGRGALAPRGPTQPAAASAAGSAGAGGAGGAGGGARLQPTKP